VLAALAALDCGGKENAVACVEGYEPCGAFCVPLGTCADLLGGGNAPGSGGEPGGGTGGEVAATCAMQTGPCGDTSSSTGAINEAFRYLRATVDGDLKTYMLTSNWWSRYDGQIITMDGLGFRIDGNTSVVSGNAPAGFPTMYVGNYQGRPTDCSDLPIPVAGITEIPTDFQTNVTSLDNANLNATYDVWFTATGDVLPSEQDNPGSGGAYLMVWMHKPTSRQPVGSAQGTQTVAGRSWTVWFGNGYNAPVVSYVSTSPIAGLTFDLNEFIRNAVANGWGVTDSQYLSVVFAGFEVWSGGNGLEMSNFCVDVR
jgi:hypothetical protein